MNENLKTALFAGAALLIAGVAWLAGPSHQRPTPTGEEARGKPMFGEALDDPLLVTRLEIMRFDDASRKCLPFEVAQVKGRRTAPAADPKQKSPPPAAGEIRWSIPSHSDYPADAKEHLAQAGQRPMLIAPGCTYDPAAVPAANLHAIRRAVEPAPA